VGSWIDMWDQLPTNKKVGLFFTNDTSGQAFADPETGVPYYCTQRGYEYVLPGLVNPGGEDYTSVIGQFKKAGCEIAATIATPPEFTNFWTQAHQQGFKPKIMTAGLALIFEQTVVAIGSTAQNLSCECSWHPTWPYKETMSGWTNQQLADDYTAKTGKQWNVCLQQLLMMDVFVDALKRTKDIDNKDEIAAAMGSTKMMTTQGPIDFTAPVGSNAHPVPNAATHALAGGQWRKSKDPRWAFQLNVMASTYTPGAEGMATGTLEPIAYA
jgi:branched-chain amino acid transport system substrate-binding protein